MPDLKSRAYYPVILDEKVRLSDTDRQGHVNNVAFSFFYEAGRAAILLETDNLLDPGCFFVIVTTTIDFGGELHYPGVVSIGSGIERIGNSSISFRQALFQGDRCASVSTSTMAQVDIAAKAARPLSQGTRRFFEKLLIDNG